MNRAESGRGHTLRSTENTPEEGGALETAGTCYVLDRVAVVQQERTCLAQAFPLDGIGDGLPIGLSKASPKVVGVASQGCGDLAGGEVRVEVLQDILPGEPGQGCGTAAVGCRGGRPPGFREHQLDQQRCLKRIEFAGFLIVHVLAEQGGQSLRTRDTGVPWRIVGEGQSLGMEMDPME